jgi:hypothetical protein
MIGLLVSKNPCEPWGIYGKLSGSKSETAASEAALAKTLA